MKYLEFDSVSYQIGEKDILRDVSFNVSSGELVALIGPNGAGKSTLFSLAAGDVSPCQGSIFLLRDDVATLPVKNQSRRRAVQTQQQKTAYSYYVREVVEMGRSPWRGTPFSDDDEAAIAEAIENGDLQDFLARDITTLSGGEQARAAYARVCAQRTKVVLADEPTAALDLGHQEQLLSGLRDQARLGAAVVTVLHDLTLAAAFADRIVLLHQGAVVEIGQPAEVLTPQLLTEVYDTPIEVIAHPSTGQLLVLPDRTMKGKP